MDSLGGCFVGQKIFVGFAVRNKGGMSGRKIRCGVWRKREG